MKKLLLTLTFLTLVFTIPAFGQISRGGTPPSFDWPRPTDIDEKIMPAFDLDAILNLAEEEKSQGLPHRFGVPFDVNFSLENSGTWETLPSGDRIWRLKIVSPLAYTLNLIYDVYWLPEGAELYLYNEDHSFILGAFTSANNKEYGYFATQLTDGDTCILEYYEPAGVSLPGQIVISRVVHGYQDFFHKNRNFGSSGDCNVNVICPEGDAWRDEIRSVVMLTEANGFRFCSGALVNNVSQDLTPYILTANHCQTGFTSVFVFNYDSTTCPYPGTNVPTTQSVSGCSRMNTGLASDYDLLLLSATPPDEYEVHYAGWSAIDTPADTAVAIHHPSGDVKKISFEYDGLVSDRYLGTQGVPDSHWKVTQWDVGTTEGGSSGSPLFNQDHRIVGQLHGGYASCTSLTSDWYGKFSMSYPNLIQWLDPDNTGILEIDGRDITQVYFTGDITAAATSLPLEAVQVWLETDNQVCGEMLTDAVGHYQLQAMPGADYTLHAEQRGYFSFHSGLFSIPDQDTTLVIDIALEVAGAAPTGLTATGGINDEVPLSWTAPAELPPDAYNVYRSTTSGGPYELLMELVSETNYTDPDVVNGRVYYYVVTSLYLAEDGESFFSTEAMATPGETLELPYFPDISDENGGGLILSVISAGSQGATWEHGPIDPGHGPGSSPTGGAVWATGLAENYANDGDVYLLTPLLDLTGPATPWLTIEHWYEFETRPGYPNVGFDGGNVAITVDAGESWTVISPTDGYPDQGIPGLDIAGQTLLEPGFTGVTENWVHSHFDLSPFIGQTVTIRFRFGSDQGNGTPLAGWFIAAIELDETVGIVDGAEVSGLKTGLAQNYPNPFNPTTTISFQLSAANRIDLTVYNTSGQLVKKLAAGDWQPGTHEVVWGGRNDADQAVGSGIYFYRLKTDSGYDETRSMILLK